MFKRSLIGLSLFAAVAFSAASMVEAADIKTVLSHFTSATAQYPTLWQDVDGLIVSRDIQAQRFALKPYAFTANSTMTLADGNQVEIGAVAGNVLLTLPNPVSCPNHIIDVQDVGGVLDATHTVNITSATVANINNSANQVSLATAYGGMRFYSTGTYWVKR